MRALKALSVILATVVFLAPTTSVAQDGPLSEGGCPLVKK